MLEPIDTSSRALARIAKVGRVPALLACDRELIPKERGREAPAVRLQDIEYLAQVPTWKDQGIDVVGDTFRGIVAPRDTPETQVAYWENVYERLTQTEEWKAEARKRLWEMNFMGSRDSRRYRVVRPDRRGFGASTPMPSDFPWTLDIIIDDHVRLMDALGIRRFHLVGAKYGGTIARAFAARRPDRVRTLTVIGTPPASRPGAEVIPALVGEFRKHGLKQWARRTMGVRLGSEFPAEGMEWWIDFMARTPVSTMIGFSERINYVDISADIMKITCPTLVITTEGSGLASVEQNRAWQRQIPNSKLLVFPGDSYHVAVTHPDACAKATLNFILQNQ